MNASIFIASTFLSAVYYVLDCHATKSISMSFYTTASSEIIVFSNALPVLNNEPEVSKHHSVIQFASYPVDKKTLLTYSFL